jgi:hypothetical protein
MFKRLLTITADVCLIVAAMAGVWKIWDSYRQQDPARLMVGTTLKNVDLNWNKTGASLVMIVNKDCHFCSESAPFYQRLIAKARNNVQIAALFPHDTQSAKIYLASLDLPISEVRGPVTLPWPLMTPTLLLCDAKGKVSRAWVGKLSAAEEAEVLSAVGREERASVASSR